MTFTAVLRKPSAWVPLAMCGAALAVVVGHIVVAGTARQADEGAAAHLWQLLMGGQVPIIVVFALRWLPREPMRALAVLALQCAAAVVSAAPVFCFNW